MTGLNGQNRASRSQVGSAHDVGCSSQIRTDTDTLKNGGSRNKGRRSKSAEVVCACSNWGRTSSCESGGQERDVGGLVRRNFLQVRVEGCIEASCGKLIRGEVGKTLTVEGVFQVLKSKSIVEDISVSDGWIRLTDHLQAV